MDTGTIEIALAISDQAECLSTMGDAAAVLDLLRVIEVAVVELRELYDTMDTATPR